MLAAILLCSYSPFARNVLAVVGGPYRSAQLSKFYPFAARFASRIGMHWDVNLARNNGGERRVFGYGRPNAPYYSHRLDQIVCWQREVSPLQNQACPGYVIC